MNLNYELTKSLRPIVTDSGISTRRLRTKSKCLGVPSNETREEIPELRMNSPRYEYDKNTMVESPDKWLMSN